jgi:hypothetical protein
MTTLTLVLALAGQTAASFAGAWTATLGPTAHVRLELQERDGVVTGRVSLGFVHLDKEGVVDEVLKPAINFTPIFDVAIRDGVLSFARLDGNDTDRFELRVAGDALELRFLADKEFLEELARDGIAPPKPIRLTKIPR